MLLDPSLRAYSGANIQLNNDFRANFESLIVNLQGFARNSCDIAFEMRETFVVLKRNFDFSRFLPCETLLNYWLLLGFGRISIDFCILYKVSLHLSTYLSRILRYSSFGTFRNIFFDRSYRNNMHTYFSTCYVYENIHVQ